MSKIYFKEQKWNSNLRNYQVFNAYFIPVSLSVVSCKPFLRGLSLVACTSSDGTTTGAE